MPRQSKLVFAEQLQSGHPRLRQLNLTNATPLVGGAATPQLDVIERVQRRGTPYAVDQKTGDVYSASAKGAPSGTYFVSQPAPAAGGRPNDPAIGVRLDLDPRTGVVTHLSGKAAISWALTQAVQPPIGPGGARPARRLPNRGDLSAWRQCGE
jgi:hypothetical protein